MTKAENTKVLNLIGLAKKAGKTGSGEFQTEEAIRSRKASLVLVAADASDNTKKLFRDKCAYYHIPIAEPEFSKEELGRAMGQEKRSCAAICEPGLANLILKTLPTNENI